jgi:hypothetical protein
MSTKTLNNAKQAKADEFYTQYGTIEEEIRHYGDYFRDKFVYCNCDDPRWSNFFKYFAVNFNRLGLRKLMAIHYKGFTTNGQKLLFTRQSSDDKPAFKFELNECTEELLDGMTNDLIIERLLLNDKNSMTPLKGSGDFRSSECLEIIKTADVVVTNPPFSLFSPFMRMLLVHKIDFLIIGNVLAATYRDLFPLFKNNKLKFGVELKSGAEFQVPDHYEINTETGWRVSNDGKKYAKLGFVRWFTNIEYIGYPKPMELIKHYSSDEYQKYDNYDAINIDKTEDIPCDYYGMMGVPTTFLDKYNPEQFEIIGIANNSDVISINPTKIYQNTKLWNEDGSVIKSTSPNGSACLLLKEKPVGTYYTADGVDGYIQMLYTRIVIKQVVK